MQSPITNESIARSINAGVGNVDEVVSHIELGCRLSPPSVRCVNTKSSSFTAAAAKLLYCGSGGPQMTWPVSVLSIPTEKRSIESLVYRKFPPRMKT